MGRFQLYVGYDLIYFIKMETKTNMLDKAIAISVAAHSGQKCRYGSPYILHLIRLMMKTCFEEVMITAILHDVVEDTDWTFEALEAEGFSNNSSFAP